MATALPVSDEQVGQVVREVRGLLERNGFQPKRTKQFVGRRGQRVTIHNLNVDARATIPLAERKRIRARVHLLEMQFAEAPAPAALKTEIDRLTSHAARIRQLHPREGQALLSRIRVLRESIRKHQQD